MACPSDFKIYYKSGCILYESKNDDEIYGYVYHDGLFEQSQNRVINNTIYLPYRKNDFWQDISNLLTETAKGTNLMNIKYDYYDKNDNIKQNILTVIKKNEQRKTLYYLTHNSQLNSVQNISAEVVNPHMNYPKTNFSHEEKEFANGNFNSKNFSTTDSFNYNQNFNNYGNFSNSDFGAQDSNPEKFKIDWFFANNQQGLFPNNNEIPKGSIITLETDKKEYVLLSSRYKHIENKSSFKLDEILIDDYNDPNDVQILNENKIFSGTIKISFKYMMVNEEKKLDGKFSYVGFLPYIEISGPNFRVYNKTWHLVYYGGITNKLKSGKGIFYNNELMITADWQSDKVSGYMKIISKDQLQFVGSASELDISEYDMNSSIYNTQRHLVDEPSCQDYDEVSLNLPPCNSYGLTRWYHNNGKLGYIGKLKNGLRNSKFSIEICKNGQIYYKGGYKDNLFDGKGVELYTKQSSINDLKEKNFLKRLGTFKNGLLNGYNCYENLSGELNAGEFNEGNLVV